MQKISIRRKKKVISDKKISKSLMKKTTSVDGKQFSRLGLKRDIMREGRVLNRHSGAVEAIAEKVSLEVEKWVLERPEITKADLNRVTAARIRKYDPDIAYLYRNRGKIL